LGSTPFSSQEYVRTCAAHGPSEVANVFWVRRCHCDACGANNFLYPYSLITLASRLVGEAHGYYGCSSCGDVTLRPLDAARRRCGGCGINLKGAREPLFAKRKVSCAHCDSEIPYAAAW